MGFCSVPHFVTVQHGPVLRIIGSVPSTAPALLERMGAFYRDDAWWCLPNDWSRVERALKALGVSYEALGNPVLQVERKACLVSLTKEGAIRIQGKLPRHIKKTWLGSERTNGHVGMSPWALPDFLQDCETERIEVTLLPDAQALLATVKDRMKRVEVALALPDEKLPEIPLKVGALRPYQRRAVAFGEACGGRFFVADGVGGGKTLEALAWKRRTDAKRVVVLVPSIAKGQWRDEIWERDGGAVRMIDGYKDGRHGIQGDGWVIMSYGVLADKDGMKIKNEGWLNALIAWQPDLIIADEVHESRGRDSARGKALKRLMQKATYSVPMTGTPYQVPMDLWLLLDGLQPGWWGTWFEFGRAFCNGQQRFGRDRTWWDMSGVSHADVLAKRLRYVMIQRTTRELQPYLPEQTRTKLHMDLDPAARLKYDAVLKEYREFIAKMKAGSKQEEEALLDASRGKRMAFIMQLRQISSTGRTLPTVELAANLVGSGKKPIIFAYFTEPLTLIRDGLRKQGLRVGFIDGSVTGTARDEVRLAFLAGQLDVLVGQTVAAGVALNLQSVSDTTITHDLTYRPLDVEQTEGRVFRSGTVNPTQHYYCLGEDTRDDRILDVLLNKMGNIEAVRTGSSAEDEIRKAIEADFFDNPAKEQQ